jgi:hypothetical protein
MLGGMAITLPRPRSYANRQESSRATKTNVIELCAELGRQANKRHLPVAYWMFPVCLARNRRHPGPITWLSHNTAHKTLAEVAIII